MFIFLLLVSLMYVVPLVFRIWKARKLKAAKQRHPAGSALLGTVYPTNRNGNDNDEKDVH